MLCRRCLLIVCLSVTVLLVHAPAAAADWPVYGRTNYRTNYTIHLPGPGLAPKWSVPVNGDLIASPVIASGRVFIGCDHGSFYTVGVDGGKLWQFTPLARIRASAAAAGNIVYVGAYDGNVYALDSSTGWLLWQMSTASWLASSPARHSGYLVAACYAGLVYAMEPMTGRLLWRYSVGNDFIEQSPAVAGSFVFVATVSGELIKLDLTNGQPAWRVMIGGRPIAPPAVSGSRIHIVSHPSGTGRGGITSVSAYDGMVRWQASIAPDRWLPPAAGMHRLYAAQDDKLYVFDEDSGVLQETIDLDGTAVGPPIVSSSRLFLPLKYPVGGAVLAVDLRRGTRWHVPLHAAPTTPLAATRSTIYFGAEDNRLYALSELAIAVGHNHIEFQDVWPFMENGKVLVPVRPVLEALGAEVRWDHATAVATARQHDRVVNMSVDPDAQIRLVAGRLIAPVRSIAVALGASVHWNAAALQVTLMPEPVRMWSDEF